MTALNFTKDELKKLEGDLSQIPAELVKELRNRGLHIATAESLTGGLVSKLITGVPGASEVLECGVCSYSNRIKHEILGVSQETLDRFTEYSAQTAEEMAEGVKTLSKADIGIATTGLAGPGGGTPERPVGLVYLGVSSKSGTFSVRLELGGGTAADRERIREQSAYRALLLALREVRGL